MADKTDKGKILKSNPHIDPQEVEKVLSLVRAVERLGVKKCEYNLAPPFSRRLQGGQEPEPDPRTAHIGR